MKKLFSLTLIACLLLAFAACGEKPAIEQAAVTELATTTEAPTTTDEQTTAQPPETTRSGSELIGKWGHVIVSENGFATRFLQLEFTAGNRVKFEFGYYGSGYGGKGGGTYSLDDPYIELDLTAEIGDEVAMEEVSMPGVVAYEFKDGDLVLYPAEGNEVRSHWFHYLDATRGLVLTKNRSIKDYE